MKANLCSKTVKIDNAYEIWQTADRSWEWRILKKWQAEENEKKNEFARWFCAVKSPFTYGDYEMGDVYVKDVKSNAIRVK